jgi:signal transduction histidine kinase
MQHLSFQNTKLFSYEDTHVSSLPSKEEYFALESHRQLISPRPVWISVFFRLLMIAVLSIGVPPYLVLIWAVVSFSANHWLIQLIDSYRQLTAQKPSLMTAQMKQTAKQFKFACEINCVVWACASALAHFWLSDLPRVLVHTVLTAILYLFLTRNCSDVKLMHRVSLILLSLPLLAALVKFIVNMDNPEALYLFLGFTFYIALNGCLIWMVGTRFNIMFLKRCESQYANMQLIETLERSQEKLSVEQEALLGANAVIQQFYSAAAHDLRQPVYAMEIYTDMLRDDPSRLETLLPKIAQSCMSINAMFNDLFDFQQKHLGDTQLELSKLNIADTLQSLALHFEPIAASKNLKISFKPLDGCVETIPLYFVRILSNLIANAITYTPTGRILVAARKCGNSLSFEIWDTGTGIDKAAQSKIFDEFYKVNPDSRKTSNLGLGLAIVKELVKRLEGAKVRVNSVVGKGTVFKLLLPITTYSAAQEPKPIESTMHYDL